MSEPRARLAKVYFEVIARGWWLVGVGLFAILQNFLRPCPAYAFPDWFKKILWCSVVLLMPSICFDSP